MVKISKIILETAGIIKPVLIKIVPISLLRKWKRKIVADNFQKMHLDILPYENGRYPKGVNLIGNIRLEAGLGQSCRLVAAALRQTGIPFRICQYSQLGMDNMGDHSWDEEISKVPEYDINLIHINPMELGAAYIRLDRSAWNYRYQIAFWLWELEEFPDEWTPYFQYLNEIWAPSEFICEAVRKKTDLPVKCMPYYVEMPVCGGHTRSDFHLPKDRFLFLMMYDSHSCPERKNPFAVLEAFKKAFDKSNAKVGLVIKINHSTKEEEEKIRRMMDGYSNIYLICEILERSKVNSLIKCVDAVVSLHRAEGFGLVLAEAMLLGTPVIATNWSANTEFMDQETACMVDYKFQTIEEEMPPFHAGCRWADPDTGQAAEYMKKLYSDQEFCERLSEKAKERVESELSMEHAVERMKDRLGEIYDELRRR